MNHYSQVREMLYQDRSQLLLQTLYKILFISQQLQTLRQCETLKLYLHWCGSVSECQGVLLAHPGALLLDSQLLENCTPPSASLSLILPVDSNSK
jgi:hypothetical protein